MLQSTERVSEFPATLPSISFPPDITASHLRMTFVALRSHNPHLMRQQKS
jgi:hypothetical protein